MAAASSGKLDHASAAVRATLGPRRRAGGSTGDVARQRRRIGPLLGQPAVGHKPLRWRGSRRARQEGRLYRAVPETSGPSREAAGEGHDGLRGPQGGESDDEAGDGESWAGFAQLLAVSVLWGSYDPTLKLLYAEERPLNAPTLTAIRTVMMAAALLLAAACQKRETAPASSRQAARQGSGPFLADGQTVLRSPDRRGMLAYSFAGILPAGVELGLYHFASVATQALGLQLTSATRALFLVQLTALLVPVISYFGGVEISSRTWTAVWLGLIGSLLVACDSISGADKLGGSGGAGEIHGMALIVASCVFNSLLTIRLGTYASRFNSVDLAAIKMLTLSTASVVWFVGGLHSADDQSVESALTWMDRLEELGLTGRPMGSYALILYSALGPGAVGNLLQVLGQSSVQPTTAQVIYSLKSVWGALLAQLLLGSEGTGPLSWAGGATVLGASLLAAAAQAEERQKKQAT